jgi:hypothetical protein
VESLKTMRNSVGALDGTLQLLQVAALPFLPAAISFPLCNVAGPYGCNNCFAGGFVEEIPRLVKGPPPPPPLPCAPHGLIPKRFHHALSGEGHVLQPHAASLISSLLDVASECGVCLMAISRVHFVALRDVLLILLQRCLVSVCNAGKRQVPSATTRQTCFYSSCGSDTALTGRWTACWMYLRASRTRPCFRTRRRWPRRSW